MFVSTTANVWKRHGKSLLISLWTSRKKFEHHGGSGSLSISCQFSAYGDILQSGEKMEDGEQG